MASAGVALRSVVDPAGGGGGDVGNVEGVWQMSTVRIDGHDWRDFDGDGVVSPGEKLAAATFKLWFGVCFLLQVAYIGACGLLHIKAADAWAAYWGGWFWLILLLATVITLVIFFWRMVHPERRERQAAGDLEHRREMQRLELQERILQLERMQGTEQHEPGTRFTQGDIDNMAYLLIKRACRGDPWSRAAMEKLGYPQDLWNKANELLKARGIRKGKGMVPETESDAWQKYVEAKRNRPPQYQWRHDEKLEAS